MLHEIIYISKVIWSRSKECVYIWRRKQSHLTQRMPMTCICFRLSHLTHGMPMTCIYALILIHCYYWQGRRENKYINLHAVSYRYWKAYSSLWRLDMAFSLQSSYWYGIEVCIILIGLNVSCRSDGHPVYAFVWLCTLFVVDW